ncbi:type III-A CRISPR-associated protein Cas10/Csm1 [Pasteurellaceae bacterium LFhippo2]|nr:type III-A CRISPR-associated protein Cas10/Csm1 [Pasteurellaceae bacterium LFhippo2]
MTLSESCQIAFASLYRGLSAFASQEELKKLHAVLPTEFQPNTISLPQHFDVIFADAEKTALGDNQKRYSEYLESLFCEIRLNNNAVKSATRYVYPIAELTPESIFPIKEISQNAQQQRSQLWQKFLKAVEQIPTTHRQNLPLWLDHFDTALQCFASNIPAPNCANISLYDHSKTVAALVTALVQTAEQEQQFLLIQGDFFGIQDFIFSGGRETNKQAAKLLRGRSFQVSLFTELAALKVLEACELPSSSQMMNAAGKFLIVAPNNKKTKDAIAAVQTELNDWFVKHTYGLIGLGIATQSAQQSQFIGEEFSKLRKNLFQQLEHTKLQRLDLTHSTSSVLDDVDYSNGVCEFNSYFPAQENGKSIISEDQINIGKYLASKDRIIISSENSDIHQDPTTKKLKLSVFGYQVIFTDNQDISGKFGQPAKTQQIKRLWDFELPESAQSPIWQGYARRYINAYIPYFAESGEVSSSKYKGIDGDNKKYDKQAVKTFDYLACEDRIPNKDNNDYIGQAALMTLKGDVDNLGTIFQEGLAQTNFAKMAALSRQMNQFFSLWLPAYCAQHSQNMYTVFAGGDDFFLIGSWLQTQKLAYAMQKAFAEYVANNPQIHFSAGMVMTKVGIPVPRLGELAEEALEQAKQVKGKNGAEDKNAVTIYQRSVSWDKWKELDQLSHKIKELDEKYGISQSYLYSLIRLAEQAENKENNIENTMWRSRFYYRTARYVVDKLEQGKRATALEELTASLGDIGIGLHKQNFVIPLFNYFYQKRS